MEALCLILDNVEERAFFTKFLEIFHCEENLYFYEAVEDFKKKPTREKINTIFKEFLSPEAKHEVNVEMLTIKIVRDVVKEMDKEASKEAFAKGISEKSRKTGRYFDKFQGL